MQSPSNKPIDDQKNFLKTNIIRNLLTDGQIYTPHTAALLWCCVFILLHFKAAVQGCWVLALSKWNRDYVVPYVRQLKQRIPGLTCLHFPSGGSIKTNGAGEVGGPAQGGTECFCSCPNISASLLTLLKTNVWIFLPLPDTGKSSSFPPRQKEKHKAKPFSNYFLM